ncbi:MAG: SHOCT domain-containing protein [Clostridia bacterium]|nr:SHOCT domain-containing protein [Clostridia bacterium]
MKNNGSVIEIIMATLGYIEGVILCLSLVFLPLGIYVIAGANYFMMCTKLNDNEIMAVAGHIKAYSIFFSIVLFPIGLLSLAIVPLCRSNKVSVEDAPMEGFVQTEEQKSSEPTEPQFQRVVSEEELEKFEQLKKYREQGLITEEEFSRAKEELFG